MSISSTRAYFHKVLSFYDVQKNIYVYCFVILIESPSLTKQNITSFYKLIAGTYFGKTTAIAYTHITITVTREDSVGNEYGYIKTYQIISYTMFV